MGVVGGTRQPNEAGVREKPQRLANLTRLRVLLIGWVLVYHLELALRALPGAPLAEAVVLKGYLGVDGFFVLSGFALFLGYRHRPPLGPAGWAAFVRSRAARIFPLHLVMLGLLVLLVAAAVLAGVRVNDPQRFGAWELLMQALLLNAWETTADHAWNYPSWALSAIWAGYLAFPALLTTMLARGAGFCWAAILACLAGLAWLGAGEDGAQLNRTLHLGLVRFGLEFVLGVALARLVTVRALDAWLVTGAVLLVPLGVGLDIDVVVVAGLAALVARLGMEPPGSTPPRDLLWRLGEASFGIYLCWVFVEAALILALRMGEPGPGGRLALMGAGLAASLALGWLAWRLVEQPAARRLAGRRTAVTP
ncbi:acyltransferase family protein [Falsiroseomonas oryzae]|uniref:acyltransferase family protein n=1 Tax=Falsiroseomonas oryzae TaxID=2766473 RepID=UPI0022EB1D1E|nr:acyltransferase [Roseomonas sp. MO-31]